MGLVIDMVCRGINYHRLGQSPCICVRLFRSQCNRIAPSLHEHICTTLDRPGVNKYWGTGLNQLRIIAGADAECDDRAVGWYARANCLINSIVRRHGSATEDIWFLWADPDARQGVEFFFIGIIFMSQHELFASVQITTHTGFLLHVIKIWLFSPSSTNCDLIYCAKRVK